MSPNSPDEYKERRKPVKAVPTCTKCVGCSISPSMSIPFSVDRIASALTSSNDATTYIIAVHCLGFSRYPLFTKYVPDLRSWDLTVLSSTFQGLVHLALNHHLLTYGIECDSIGTAPFSYGKCQNCVTEIEVCSLAIGWNTTDVAPLQPTLPSVDSAATAGPAIATRQCKSAAPPIPLPRWSHADPGIYGRSHRQILCE